MTKCRLAACLVVLAVIGTASAGELGVPALPIDVAPLPSDGDTLTLDLATAYQVALSRNLDLQVGRYDVAAANNGILASGGLFDPTLGFDVNGDYSKSPSASELEGAVINESRNVRFGLGIDQLLPTGTQLSAQFGTRRAETNNRFYNLNPNWSSDLTLSLTQPLLNGFGTLVNRSRIIVARNSRDQVAAGFEIQVVNVLWEVERAYWDLVASREAVEVQEQSLELAERLLEETRQRVDVGTSAPIDLVQSEARVALRRQELIYARNSAANAEDALKALLGFDSPEEWMMSIATTEGYKLEPAGVDLRASIDTALKERPELEQQQLDLAYREHTVQLARNRVMPRLDLQGSYGYSGIAGKGEVAVPVLDPETGLPILDENGDEVVQIIQLDGGFSDSFKQVRELDYPHWTMGMTLSVPVGNHDAKASLAQRRYEMQRSRTQLAALQQQIIHDVRRAVRALEDGAAAIDAAVASRDAAERNLEAEQTKFANGLSTNYLVLEIQEDLAQAQLSELQAWMDYRKALIGYRVATGQLLEEVNVEIIDPGAPEAPMDFWGDVEWMQFTDLKGARGRVTEPPRPVEPTG